MISDEEREGEQVRVLYQSYNTHLCILRLL